MEPITLLLVDDDRAARDAVAGALVPTGLDYRIVEVDDVPSALSALAERPFDCVLLDLQPTTDGLSALIEAKHKGHDVPVIVLTGHGDEQSAVAAMKAGASDYVSKASASADHLRQSITQAVRTHRAERGAREAERDAIALAEAIPQLVWIVDSDFQPLFVNRRWVDYTLYDVDRFRAEGWAAVVHPEDLPDTLLRWKESSGSGVPFEVEYRLRSGKGGSYRWHLARAMPRFGTHGVASKWFGTCTDIDDQRRLSDERAHLLTALDLLANTGSVLNASFDLDATVQSVTRLVVPAFADWCSAYLKEPDDGVRLVAATHVDPVKEDLLRARVRRFTTDRNVPYGYMKALRTGETELIERVDRSVYLGLASGDPEHTKALEELGAASTITVPLSVKGHVIGAMVLAFSSSGRHYTEGDVGLAEELARRVAIAVDSARLFEMAQVERRRVEEANRAKDEFLAVVSHELRTPLNAMLGWTRMLRTGGLDAAKRDRALETVERNARAQAQLIEDLLDVSRIITGKLTLRVVPVELTGVIEAAVEAVRPAADAKGVAIETTVERGLGSIIADPDRLQQVTWNLLSNAVKFTKGGGRVRADVSRVGTNIEMRVEDTGQGIPLEFLPYVFDRFRQAEGGTSRSKGGLGLGLAIVRHLVELHGGVVTAQSAGVGAGSTFTAVIPIAPPRRDASPTAVSSARTFASSGTLLLSPSLSGVTILVVDDEQDARELLKTVLEHAGATVHARANAADALEAFRQFRPDVLVSDVGMPTEDGYSLIRKVRALERPSEARVAAVALTAYARHEDKSRALFAGFSVHVAKPIEPAELVAVIASLVPKACSPGALL